MLEGALGAASAQANHQHVGDARVPKPGGMKQFGVFKMPLQRIGDGHLRLRGVIEVKRADAGRVHDANVMIGGGDFVKRGSSQRRPHEPGRQQQGCASGQHSFGL